MKKLVLSIVTLSCAAGLYFAWSNVSSASSIDLLSKNVEAIAQNESGSGVKKSIKETDEICWISMANTNPPVEGVYWKCEEDSSGSLDCSNVCKEN